MAHLGGGGGEARVRVVRCPNCDKLLPEIPNLALYRCGGCNAALQAKKPIPPPGSLPQRSGEGNVDYFGKLDNCLERKSGFTREEMVMVNSREGDYSHSESVVGDEDVIGEPKTAIFDAMGDDSASDFEELTKENIVRNLLKNHNWVGTSRVNSPGQDRVELLRKLDELRDHISRSCEIADRPKERRPVSRRTASSSFNDKSRRTGFPGERSPLHRVPACHSHCAEKRDMSVSNCCCPSHSLSGFPKYGDRFPRVPYSRRTQHNYRYTHLDPSPVFSNHYDSSYHQSVCSCLHCYGQHLLPPRQVPLNYVTNQRASYFKEKYGLYPVDRSSMPGSDYDERSTNSPLHSHELQTKRRAALLRKRPERSFRPIGGAAPFIVCHNCFELLQLPLEVLDMPKGKNKLRCGSCSQTMIFKHDGKTFKLFDSQPPMPMNETSENSNSLNNQTLCYEDIFDGNPAISYSEDYDSRGDNIHLADSVSPAASCQMTEREYELSYSAKMEGISKSSSSCKDVESPKAKNDSGYEELIGVNPIHSYSEYYDNSRGNIHLDDSASHTTRYEVSEREREVNMSYSVKMEGLPKSYSRRKDVESPKSNKDSGCEDHDGGDCLVSYSKDYNSRQDNIHLVSPTTSSKIEDRECGINMSYSEKMEGLSKSSSRSRDVESPENVTCQRDSDSHTELPFDGQMASRASSLRDYSCYPFINQEIDGFDEENMSENFDHTDAADINDDFRRQSNDDFRVSSEMNLSGSEYSHSGFSQDSRELRRGEDQPSIAKNGDSSFAGIFKKRFKDFSLFNQSAERSRTKVSVNGYPISDRSLKKAEKKAGPVDPGDYWYDYHAGFWGVMGRECLGIIPPFIREFNYPMRRNCADGDTGVFVNGRELHQKDLELLVKRGLPPITGQSYVVEISGKIIDEASGKKLRSLGKLAPT
uniref:Uncharacterized protein n=1 Tax=Ananas comosus var. bracteatus TaxID=296719 RepID=A0A6V7NZS1_ANACO|nr:unnamed protein product [Ananas comosus var. bracteatus]